MPLDEPKNVRKLKIKNCANCAYRKYLSDVYFNSFSDEMYCSRTEDENPWGDEIDIHYTVCDGFKKAGKE